MPRVRRGRKSSKQAGGHEQDDRADPRLDTTRGRCELGEQGQTRTGERNKSTGKGPDNDPENKTDTKSLFKGVHAGGAAVPASSSTCAAAR